METKQAIRELVTVANHIRTGTLVADRLGKSATDEIVRTIDSCAQQAMDLYNANDEDGARETVASMARALHEDCGTVWQANTPDFATEEYREAVLAPLKLEESAPKPH